MFHSLYHGSVQNPAQPLTTDTSGLPSGTDRIFLEWPASYMDGFREISLDEWQLEIDGLVDQSQTFSYQDLMNFTRIQQNRRLVFADGWTYRAPWEGFVISELLHRVSPLPEAQYLIQTNLAGHQECMALKDLFAQRALFCMRVAGKPLPFLYGGPLRLMVFDHYAHKGLGQLVRLELSDQPIPGHFAQKGYASDGQIEPGNYYASDLNITQAIKTPGEVTQW